MILIDSHLDLSWNALNWNRDLRFCVEEIRRAEVGMQEAHRGGNTVSFPEMRRGEVPICLVTMLARSTACSETYLDYRSLEIASAETDNSMVELRMIVDQIDHLCQLAGNAAHAGIGSDLDGGFGREQSPSDLDTIADLQRIPRLLEAKGYAQRDIESVMRGNWLRFFKNASSPAVDTPQVHEKHYRTAQGAFLRPQQQSVVRLGEKASRSNPTGFHLRLRKLGCLFDLIAILPRSSVRRVCFAKTSLDWKG
jgi:hypothetical protein